MIEAQTPGEPSSRGSHIRRLTAFIPVLLVVVGMAHAQSPRQDSVIKQPDGDTIARPVFVGLFAGPSWSWHSSTIPDEISCGLGFFSDARVESFPVGLFFDFPLPFEPTLRLISRYSYERVVATLPGTRYSFGFLREGNSVEETAETLTELVAEFQIQSLSTGVAYEPIESIPLRIGVGATVTRFMSSSERRTERYLSPIDARFPESQSQTRTLTIATPLEFRPFYIGADLMVEYRLRISRTLLFFPQIRAAVPFGSIVSNGDWRIFPQIRPSLGVGWEFFGQPAEPVLPPDPIQPPDPTPIPDPPVAVQMPVLKATVVAKGVDDQGREYDNPAIEIEQASWVEVVPVIPMIFFDSASASIPHRYSQLRSRERAALYSTDSLVQVSPVDIHWQTLNVIGSRLRDNPGITVTIVGTGSSDERAETTGLAASRARSIGGYLREIWGIDSSRLTVSTSSRPAAASNEERAEGREENRRVELRFNRVSAGDPLLIRRMAAVASPPAVKFSTNIIADTSLAGWNVTVMQGEKELLRFEGSSAAGSLGQSKLWPLTDLRVNRDLTPIRYHLEVTDVLGQRATDSGTFRVQERVVQRDEDSTGSRVELYGYNLVGFDYNSYELLPRQRAELTVIARAASAQAQMTIVGYTDRVGDPERNRQLSLERARVVYEAIRAEQRRLGIAEAQAVSVHGFGQQESLFDNDLPEGRILSRMALVTITRLRLK